MCSTENQSKAPFQPHYSPIVHRISSHISLICRLDHFLARWGWKRGSHRVAPGLYSIGSPTAEAPVFVTTNYTLSFDALRSSITGMVWEVPREVTEMVPECLDSRPRYEWRECMVFGRRRNLFDTESHYGYQGGRAREACQPPAVRNPPTIVQLGNPGKQRHSSPTMRNRCQPRVLA